MKQKNTILFYFMIIILLLITNSNPQDKIIQDSLLNIEIEPSHIDLVSDSSGFIKPRIVDTNIVIPTLDFSGVSLQDAFTALIRAYKLSVYIDSSVTGNISMRLDNVSLNDALLFIIKEYGLDWNGLPIWITFRPASDFLACSDIL